MVKLKLKKKKKGPKGFGKRIKKWLFKKKTKQAKKQAKKKKEAFDPGFSRREPSTLSTLQIAKVRLSRRT